MEEREASSPEPNLMPSTIGFRNHTDRMRGFAKEEPEGFFWSNAPGCRARWSSCFLYSGIWKTILVTRTDTGEVAPRIVGNLGEESIPTTGCGSRLPALDAGRAHSLSIRKMYVHS